MATPPEPLKHHDAEKKEDVTLAQEASAHLAKSPALQVLAELLGDLRARTLAWWTPDGLRTRYGATDRMRWFRERPDIRQQVTTGLTGLVPKSARKKEPDFQASLVDAAVDDGDVTSKVFEEAFDVRDLAVYGPAPDYWRQFRQRMPWQQDTPAHHELVGLLLKALLTDKGVLGLSRKPILTAWELRTAIVGKVWHTRIPVDVRVAIDDARFEREKAKPKEPFVAKDDLAIALPEIIAANVPLKELARVLDAAERAMGFDTVAEVSGSIPPSDPAPQTVNPAIPSGAPSAPAAAASQTPSVPSPPPAVANTTSVFPPPMQSSFPRSASKGPPPLRAPSSTIPFVSPSIAAEAPSFPPKIESFTEEKVLPPVDEESEMLFDVDIGSTDDLVAAEKSEDRPTRTEP